MNELSKSAKLYMQKFCWLKKQGCRLELYPSATSPTGIITAKKFGMKNLIEGYDPRTLVYDICGRWPSKAEVFYVVGAYCVAFVERIVIPQIELTEIFKHKVGAKIFEGVYSVSFNPLVIKMSDRKDKSNRQKQKNSNSKRESKGVNQGNRGDGCGGDNTQIPPNETNLWYHGSKYSNKVISKLSDLKTDKGSSRGDFGQGAYLTHTREIAENQIINQQTGNLLKGKWCNNSLDEKIEECLEKGKPDKREIIGRNNETYSIYIFPKADKAWKDALIQGWVYKNRVGNNEYAMVYGPIANNQCVHLSRNIEKALGDKKQLQKEIDNFHKHVKAIGVGDGMAFQLCCYENEVMSNFDTVL